MHYSFQDMNNIYLVLDLLTGGDLRYIIIKNRIFNEEQTSKLNLTYIYLIIL